MSLFLNSSLSIVILRPVKSVLIKLHCVNNQPFLSLPSALAHEMYLSQSGFHISLCQHDKRCNLKPKALPWNEKV